MFKKGSGRGVRCHAVLWGVVRTNKLGCLAGYTDIELVNSICIHRIRTSRASHVAMRTGIVTILANISRVDISYLAMSYASEAFQETGSISRSRVE